MIDDKIYQKIYNELCEYLTSDWQELVVYLEYGEDSYTFAFYEKAKGEYINGYDLPCSSAKVIDSTFDKIDKMILKERKKEKGDLWSNMTLVVTRAGDMQTDFDYSDLSEGTYQYKSNWKKKYLK